MSARVLPAAVLRALRELSDAPGHRDLEVAMRGETDLNALAWRAALAVASISWDSTMELRAARGFCLALLAGDLDRAARCAVWIYAPGEAFRTAQAELNARTQGAVS